jgi:hypothetical protein
VLLRHLASADQTDPERLTRSGGGMLRVTSIHSDHVRFWQDEVL